MLGKVPQKENSFPISTLKTWKQDLAQAENEESLHNLPGEWHVKETPK